MAQTRSNLSNIWATIAEFPEPRPIARKFGVREFELVTIGTDDPKDSAKVKAFLEKRGAELLYRLKALLKAEGARRTATFE